MKECLTELSFLWLTATMKCLQFAQFLHYNSPQQKKDNFSIAFIQLYNFIRPLYLAYSCEEAKGSQHKVLASALKDTSFHLNNTVWRVRREVSYLQNWTLPHEETDILMSLRFYFTNGKRKAEYGFKEKTKIEIVTCWGRQKPLVDQDSDSQYCWSALKTDN